jgi:hypothetical protein
MIERGTWWIFRGFGDGQGMRHMIVAVSRQEITTWSEPAGDGDEVGGYSWRGSVAAFCDQFLTV